MPPGVGGLQRLFALKQSLQQGWARCPSSHAKRSARSSTSSASSSGGGGGGGRNTPTSGLEEQPRRPGLWDRVVLSPGVPATRGLRQGVAATVIKLHPNSRPEYFYRVEIPDKAVKPWLACRRIIGARAPIQ